MGGGPPNSLMRLTYVAKRGFDVVAASTVLAFTLAFMILIAAVVVCSEKLHWERDDK
jgi:lipopolysaccharide/colanic/teichoic acid biosynthesis glycosyltransferase